MAYGQMGGQDRPPMVDVSAMGLKCAECNTDVKELPFQPSADRPVFCRECNRNRKKSFGGNRF